MRFAAASVSRLRRVTWHLRARLSRHRRLLVLALLLNDLRWRVRLAVGRTDTKLGATHASLSTDQSVRYIEDVVADYQRYGELTEMYGRAVELGPGDNAGVALLLRHAGCERVDLVDRFVSYREPQHQAAIYQKLSDRHDLEAYRCGESWDERQLDGVVWHLGTPAETYFREARHSGREFDLIVSRAVLQYLSDPLVCLEDMVYCLSVGGRMVHKIDLRDHGLLSPYHSELSWLEIPDLLYRQMIRHSGGVNRVLWHRYRACLENLRQEGTIEYRCFATRLVGAGPLEPHSPVDAIDPALVDRACAEVEQRRTHFAREFRDVNARDLAIAGIFVSVRRKAC